MSVARSTRTSPPAPSISPHPAATSKAHPLPLVRPDLAQFPKILGDWRGEDSGDIDIAARETLQLDQFIRRTYHRADGAAAHLYIGYWHRQTGDHQAAKHSPALCLPANGWTVQSSQRLALSKIGPKVMVNSLVADRSTKRFQFLYWFFSGADTYAEEWLTLIKVSFGILAGRRPDGGIVEISVLVNPAVESSGVAAENISKEFAATVAPEIARLMQPGVTP